MRKVVVNPTQWVVYDLTDKYGKSYTYPVEVAAKTAVEKLNETAGFERYDYFSIGDYRDKEENRKQREN